MTINDNYSVQKVRKMKKNHHFLGGEKIKNSSNFVFFDLNVGDTIFCFCGTCLPKVDKKTCTYVTNFSIITYLMCNLLTIIKKYDII